MKDLTVLAPQHDPFRCDTAAGHRDGRWFGEQVERLIPDPNTAIHLRGLHYALVGTVKPDGTVYANDTNTYGWLCDTAAKRARFLGYVPFERIIDQRNTPPTVRLWTPPDPLPQLSIGLDIEIPSADDIDPFPYLHDFRGAQPYRLVFVGEKASLGQILNPLADRFMADLYLPSGNNSDTLWYRMAKDAADDGRPLRVIYTSDADPGGWGMPSDPCRKLQAFETLFFPDLDWEVIRAALTPDQVRGRGLPSSPIKPGEKRAGAWREAFGMEQVEVDAAIVFEPAWLTSLIVDAVSPFFDFTLAERVEQARAEWTASAQRVIDEHLDADARARLRDQMATVLDDLAQQIDDLNAAARVGAEDFDLPEPVLPEPVIDEARQGVPLCSSEWSFPEQCAALKAAKAFES